MSDFPSINSLLGKSGKKPATAGALPGTDTGEVAEEKFAKKMQEIDLKTKEEMTAKQAVASGLPYIDLSAFPITGEALRIIPEEMAVAKKIICFFSTVEDIRLGAVNYSEEIKELAYQLGERHHANVQIYLISENSFAKAIKLYANLPVVKPISKDINITDEELEKFKAGVIDFRSLEKQFLDVPISDILTLMIASALKVDSSDIHVEAEEKGIMVRYRIDGVLHNVATLPKEQWKKFVSRIKLLAVLKINITDRPQDGRVTLKLSSGSLDVRVSTMPNIFGESVVMRILHSSSKG